MEKTQKYIGFRVPQKLFEDIQRIAAYEQRSISQIVRFAIDEFVKTKTQSFSKENES